VQCTAEIPSLAVQIQKMEKHFEVIQKDLKEYVEKTEKQNKKIDKVHTCNMHICNPHLVKHSHIQRISRC
jgi:hypothetical protein